MISMPGTATGGLITEGEVENTSGEKMESIQAVAKYYTASGDFVTSDDALVEYNPLLAGQRTLFKTITKGNPSIKRCNIAFKHFWGTEIRFEDAKLRRKNDAAARNADPRLVEAQKILIRLGYETGF
ncbi:MAG: hypothetical protein L0312_18255, partial [Acidobacteria bacterium]|nr:hypothetical protein [Acidobacteriota bacterium]